MWATNIVFAVIMTAIVLCALFGRYSEIVRLNFFAELVAALGLLSGAIFAYRKFLPSVEKWSKRRMLVLELLWFALLAAMVFYFAIKLRVVDFTWDPFYLRYGIDELSAGRSLDHRYYNWFPYQRSLVYFVFPIVKFLRFIGLNMGTSTILVMINVAAIMATLLFAYLAARALLGRPRALFWLLLSPVALLPLLLYAPICYTDTTSALFVSLGFYLVVKLYKGCRHEWAVALLFGLTCFFGAQIKATAAILLIATAIVLALKIKTKMLPGLIVPITVFILAFVPLMLAWNAVRSKPEHPEAVVPVTHFVAMGLKDKGGFNNEDASEAANVIAAGGNIKEFELNKVKRRLADYGVGGYLRFVANKVSYTWGDGEYFAPVKLARLPYGENSKIAKFTYGEYKDILAFIANAVHLSMLLLFAYMGWRSLKNFDCIAVLLKLCVCGVFLFFLVWEARSRYLLNFLPLFTILGFAFLRLLEPKLVIHSFRQK